MPASVRNPKTSRGGSASERVDLGRLGELHWASILDAFPEGISIHAATGEIVWANSKLCELYCRPLSELQGLSCEQVFHEGSTSCRHEEVVATGRSAQLDSGASLSGKTLSVTIEPILNEDKVCGFVRMVRDTTEHHLLQEQLLTTERFATLGRILSGIAHDVGTPLNIISGYSEFLLMRMKPEDHGHKELSAILNQTKRIAALFGEALDLARPPQHRMDAIEIKAVLENSLNLAGHFLRKADVKADLTCRKTPPLIYGESSQLTQAFLNLLLNAGERIETGGKLEIVIDEWPDRPGFLTLEFYGTEADGHGHDFSQSLGRFLVLNEEAKTRGLGLSLARDILKEAGAEIASRRAGERGVPLIIHLPAGKPDAANKRR